MQFAIGDVIRNNLIGSIRPSAVIIPVLLFLCLSALCAFAEPVVRTDGGKYYDAQDVATYNIKPDGTVDWYTYSGFRRYHSECHVCHGPDAMGSTVAPALKDSLKALSYDAFVDVVVNGREVIRADKQSKMPALGLNSNVMCYIDDIYVYLKARADGALPRGRPRKREPKSEQAREDEAACLG